MSKKRNCTFLTVANLKGGVGKTTTVVNLAAALAQSGRKIAVVDLDFQGSATTGLGMKRNASEHNVYSVLTKKVPLIEAINPTPVKNVDLLAAHISLMDFARSHNSAIGREYLFEDWRESGAFDDYDVVIFDTHPDMDCLTMSALVASDYYLVPLFAELDPIVGLSDMFEQIDLVKKRYNKMLSLIGILITKFDKTESTHRKLEAKIREGEKQGNYNVFTATIPASKRLSAAKLMSKPVVTADPGSNVATAFLSLAGELAPRLKPRLTGRSEKSVTFSQIEKSIRTEAENAELI